MLKRGRIAGALGAQVVLSEAVFDLGLLEYAVHEPLPHAVPAVRFAGGLVNVSGLGFLIRQYLGVNERLNYRCQPVLQARG